MTNQKILLSRRQAAQALSVSIRTIDYLIARKNLGVTRIGKRVLISWDALLELVGNMTGKEATQ